MTKLTELQQNQFHKFFERKEISRMNMDIHKHTKYDGDLLEQIRTSMHTFMSVCVCARVCVDACINVHKESKKCVREYAQFCMHFDRSIGNVRETMKLQ